MRTSFHDVIGRAPMLRVALFFIGGLAMGPHVDAPLLWAATAGLTTFTIWCLLALRGSGYEARWRSGAVLFPALFLFGIAWSQFRDPREAANVLGRERRCIRAWQVNVVEPISSGSRTARMWVHVRNAIDSTGAHPCSGHVLLTVMKDSLVAAPSVGDELVVIASIDTLDRIPDPGGFDQRSWAASYGVFHESFAGRGDWRVLKRNTTWTSLFEDSRTRIVAWLKASDLEERERGMVKAILLGIRDELQSDQKAAFARSGTMHVLAVSGSHVALIYAFLMYAFRRAGQIKWVRIVRSLIVLTVLWYYAGLTGATPSVLRATVTLSFFCIADMYGRLTEPTNSLAGAAFILVLWDPLMLAQLSFQLSFLAVLGIALFYDPLVRSWAPPNKVLAYFWSLFSVSIAAQALTTPLAIYAFKAFPVWFLPANLVVVGLVALGVYGGALLLLVHRIPVLGDLITWCMQALLKTIGWTTETFANLPGAYPGVRLDGLQCVGLYALVLTMAGWFFERWHWARIATITILALLLGSWAWTAHQRNDQRMVVLYGDRHQLCGALISGRTMRVFADTLDHLTLARVEQNCREAGVQRLDMLPTNPRSFELREGRVLFVEADSLPLADGRRTLSVVLTDDGRYMMDSLQARCRPVDGYVLGPTITRKRRVWLRRWCAEHNIHVHDIQQDGAYVRGR